MVINVSQLQYLSTSGLPYMLIPAFTSGCSCVCSSSASVVHNRLYHPTPTKGGQEAATAPSTIPSQIMCA